jgi:curved DNA binding protein
MTDEAPERNVEDPDVITKYKTAADIANQALIAVAEALKPGKSIAELCRLGDETIRSRCATVFNKSKGKKREPIGKGVAFPTCIGINNCAGHFSPLESEDATIKDGDICSIDLGAHIDGYVALLAATGVASTNGMEWQAHPFDEFAWSENRDGSTVLQTGGTSETEATPMELDEGKQSSIPERAADAICAAYYAAEAVLRLLRPGCTNTQVTEVLAKVAADFGCSVVEGVLSHEMKRYVIDGRHVILSKPTIDQRVEECQFEENTVFAIDVVMSTSETGKVKPGDVRTTVFKRAIERDYLLKMKAARQLLNEVNRSSPVFPFTLRGIVPNDPENKVARLGIGEMQSHGLVIPYPVLYEKDGHYIARFKYTALILPTYTQRITAMPFPRGVTTTKKIQDESVRRLLQQPVGKEAKRLHKQAARASMRIDADNNVQAAAKTDEGDMVMQSV